MDVIVIGCGFAGSIMAQKFASQNKKVLVIDERSHIAGNMYDYEDENGVLVHEYGPHLLHTNHKEVYDYLYQFDDFYKYEHRVLGYVNDKLVPIPFNLKSIELSFDEDKAQRLKDVLINEYGMEQKVSILELRKNANQEVKELAEYIFEHVFKYYTMKQWGLTVDEIDPSVVNRVPVFVSYDDRYFQDEYQYMPKNGYTKLFENILKSPNITLQLNTPAHEILEFKYSEIHYNGKKFDGKVIFTGAIDQLFNYQLGLLPYRSLNFVFERLLGTYQQVGTVNYPTPYDVDKFTRITEYKHMMEKQPIDTTIVREYSLQFELGKGLIPYYPIASESSSQLYESYLELASNYSNLYLLGRLANYKYYNMDIIINEALALFELIKD